MHRIVWGIVGTALWSMTAAAAVPVEAIVESPLKHRCVTSDGPDSIVTVSRHGVERWWPDGTSTRLGPIAFIAEGLDGVASGEDLQVVVWGRRKLCHGTGGDRWHCRKMPLPAPLAGATTTSDGRVWAVDTSGTTVQWDPGVETWRKWPSAPGKPRGITRTPADEPIVYGAACQVAIGRQGQWHPVPLFCDRPADLRQAWTSHASGQVWFAGDRQLFAWRPGDETAGAFSVPMDAPDALTGASFEGDDMVLLVDARGYVLVHEGRVQSGGWDANESIRGAFLDPQGRRAVFTSTDAWGWSLADAFDAEGAFLGTVPVPDDPAALYVDPWLPSLRVAMGPSWVFGDGRDDVPSFGLDVDLGQRFLIKSAGGGLMGFFDVVAGYTMTTDPGERHAATLGLLAGVHDGIDWSLGWEARAVLGELEGSLAGGLRHGPVLDAWAQSLVLTASHEMLWQGDRMTHGVRVTLGVNLLLLALWGAALSL